MEPKKTDLHFAKSFVWLAWICALGLLVFVFQDILDQQYNPNQRPIKNVNSQGRAEVTLQRNRYGHYVTSGEINGNQVTFLLDTGATTVSIPQKIAEQLALKKGIQQRVQTANGVIFVYKTVLNSLRIGDITLYNVAANINPKMHDDEILLGMSVLGKIEFRQTGDQLILQEQG